MNQDTLETAARLGYAARGVIYLVVGGIAAVAAFQGGGQTPGSEGALVQIVQAPFGRVLLGIVALGLLGYSAWRAIQALMDVDGHGTDLEGLAIRAGLGTSAIVHTGLAFLAFRIAFGAQSGSSGSSKEEWTAWLLQQPYGVWLVIGVGIIFAIVGIAHCIKAYQGKFEKRFEPSVRDDTMVQAISRTGLTARGIVFMIIAGFFVYAAVQHDPSKAGGLSDVLSSLQQQAYGNFLLALAGIGLLAFGSYSLLEALYRKVDTRETQNAGVH